jgi:hypothetical protein
MFEGNESAECHQHNGLLQFGKKPYARKKKVMLVFGVRELT